jgi:carboxyl-terminal processing protease
MKSIFKSAHLWFFLSLFFTWPAFGQKELIDEVLKIAEKHSINRDSLDFKKIKEVAYNTYNSYTSLSNGDPKQDSYRVIRIIVSQLNDHHSSFMEKGQVNKWQNTSKQENVSFPFSGKVIDGDIGYIEMKGFGSGDPISQKQYANELQSLIKSLDSPEIKGWVLDLRQNTGGNCWPMLAGIGPLLGNGVCGYFIDNKRHKSSWYYNDGQSGIDSFANCKVSIEPYKLLNPDNPIAILTGLQTASSGEVVVTAFRGKANTKSFGQSTMGLSTGNSPFKLSDGSMILLATSIYADRNENSYGGQILPDVPEDFDHVNAYSQDRVVKRAIEWIREGK